MEPLSPALIKQLKISNAVKDEAAATRNLVPGEPGWDRLSAKASEVDRNFVGILRNGFLPTPQVELIARKPGHGVRPIPYWGPLERILYRALSEIAMKPFEKPDRSPEAYVSFVKAPVHRSFELQQEENPDSDDDTDKFFHFLESPLKYVVKSDITAFYQFVDHGILKEELLNHGADFEATSALVELLRETQGRSYGLPQLLEPSDWLSEVYIERVHRQIVRRGLEAWRFNDDFRIATRTYEDALRAIEVLDEASRANGLVISEFKTLTYGMTNYLIDTLALGPSEELEKFIPDEVETIVGDYTDDFDDDEDGAFQLLASASSDANIEDPDAIRLRNIKTEDVRRLRRALGALSNADDERAVTHLIKLLIFAPSLTPSICKYVTSLTGDELGLDEFFDEVIAAPSLNDWQRVWITGTMSTLGLLDGNAGAARRDWVISERRETRDSVVRSYCSSGLGRAGFLDITEIVADAEDAPQALLTVYADAISEVAGRKGEDATKLIANAWGDRTTLHKILLGAIPE
ncbi:hypothetical protein GCM10027053_14880 [Intrasporangium mesophilum]